MNMPLGDVDVLLAKTFAAHEHAVPAERDVLAAVHDRIRRAKVTRMRTLAIAASVTGAAAAAAGAVTLGSAGSAPVRQALASSAGPTAGRLASIAPLTLPFDLGWLPSGRTDYLARRINVGAVSVTSAPSFDGEYLLTVTAPDSVLVVDVQQVPGELQDVAFKSGPGRAVTIAGRPGIESSNADGPGGYELYFTDSSGGLMYVNVAEHVGAATAADQLTAIGQRVAANVHFPGSVAVSPTFGIGYLPAGLRVRAFDVERGAGFGRATKYKVTVGAGAVHRGTARTADGGSAAGILTSYELGTTRDLESDAFLYTEQGAQPGGTPGRPVQGHATSYRDDAGYLTLRVLDAVHGNAVAIASARLPLAELYAIADGLQLPS